MISDARPMRVAFLGSGAFGVPSLRALAASPEEFEVVLVVTAPDRPAGRGLRAQPTPVAEAAAALGLPMLHSENVNDAAPRERLAQVDPDALVVIAFGQKIGVEIRDRWFSINLHASLLPAFRGAAPIQRALMAGETVTGVSVIELAERMDAGGVFDRLETEIEPRETAGELHDRLAELGIEPLLRTLRRRRTGGELATPQDDSRATRAAKISRSDAVIDFARDAESIRGWVHGLSPWPGCTISLPGPRGPRQLRLLRVEAVSESEVRGISGLDPASLRPGDFAGGGLIRCGRGFLHPLQVQPSGGRAMEWDAFLRGHPLEPGVLVTSP